MEELLAQVLDTHNSAIKDLQLKNDALEKEVLKLRAKISDLCNARCPNCKERMSLLNATENAVNSNELCARGETVDGLIFDAGEETQVALKARRRQKRHIDLQSSSHEERKRKWVNLGPNTATGSLQPEKETSKRHKLVERLENERTQFPESVNPAQVLVPQTCDGEIDGTKSRCGNGDEDVDLAARISVIPETMPMDFDVQVDENVDVAVPSEQDEKCPSTKLANSPVCLDTSDNDSLRDLPSTVQKIFVASPLLPEARNLKPRRLVSDASDDLETNVDKCVMKSPSPAPAAKSKKMLPPSICKVNYLDMSTQIGITQALALCEEDSQDLDPVDNVVGEGEKKGVDGTQGNQGKGPSQSDSGKTTPEEGVLFKGIGRKGSPGEKLRKRAIALKDEVDWKKSSSSSCSLSKCGPEKSPVISQGFKVKSNSSSSASSDSPVILKVSDNLKNTSVNDISGSTMRKKNFQDALDRNCGSDGNGVREGVKENKRECPRACVGKNFEGVSSQEFSSDSQEPGADGSQVLVSSKMILSEKSAREKETEAANTSKMRCSHSLASSKSDSYLQSRKLTSDRPSTSEPSSQQKKHSSLPNSPLNSSQVQNTIPRNSDEEFRSDAGFKNSAEDVWLSAKKPEQKRPKRAGLNVSVLPSPRRLKSKNLRQQTIHMTLKKNTEKDLSEIETFNGGVLTSTSGNAKKDDFLSLSFELNEDDDENIPPSPQKPRSQRLRSPRKFITGMKPKEREVKIDVTFDPDATVCPHGEASPESVENDARPCFSQGLKVTSPVETNEVTFHDFDSDASYSLLPQVGDRFAASAVARKDKLAVDEVGSLVTQNSASHLLCSDSDLPDENQFHSTCRSAVFGKGGKVTVGLPPNFSDLMSEIPQNSEFPAACGSKDSVGRGKAKLNRRSKMDTSLFDGDTSQHYSSSLKGDRVKTRKNAMRRSPGKSRLLLDPDHDSQTDFMDDESLEKSVMRFHGERQKRFFEGQEVLVAQEKNSSKTTRKKFQVRKELPRDMNVDEDDESFNFYHDSAKELRGGIDQVGSETFDNRPGEKVILASQKSYVFDGKGELGETTHEGMDFRDENDEMIEICKSMKFGAQPKTFPEDSQEDLDDLLNPPNQSRANLGGVDEAILGDEEFGSNELKDNANRPEIEGEDEYPCPSFVATPVDECLSEEKRVTRSRRQKKRKNESLMDDSFDRVPQDKGPGYAHLKVERDRQKRTHHMDGYDCRGCKEYYNDLPQVERNKRMQETSRHRAHYPPPDTPPGYWSLMLPPTQASLKMKGHLDQSYSAESGKEKTHEVKPVQSKEKFRRRKRLQILPPKFDDKK